MEHNEWMKKLLHKLCELLELITAVLMIIGLLLAVIGLITDGDLFRNILFGDHAFMNYIVRVFTIVIGIEFLEMLCAPTPDGVIQTLIFLVARHMIVGEATPTENFISILSIALLFGLKYGLKALGVDEGHAAFSGLGRLFRKGSHASPKADEPDRPE